eukprot:g1228.t1
MSTEVVPVSLASRVAALLSKLTPDDELALAETVAADPQLAAVWQRVSRRLNKGIPRAPWLQDFEALRNHPLVAPLLQDPGFAAAQTAVQNVPDDPEALAQSKERAGAPKTAVLAAVEKSVLKRKDNPGNTHRVCVVVRGMVLCGNMSQVASIAEWLRDDDEIVVTRAGTATGLIGTWDVSKITNMDRVFYGAKSFNQDISSWDVSAVTTMNYMFWEANKFNGDIAPWTVSGVTDMSYMFRNADFFNRDISYWDVSSVLNMDY